MLPLEHSAKLLTCIKRYSILKNNFGIHFEWPLKTGFTVILFLASGPVAYQQVPISEEFIPEITGPKEERIPSPIEAVKPMFIERLQNSLLVPDTNIIFECYVSGQPFPEIYWFKGDKPLKPDARYVLQGYRLTFFFSVSKLGPLNNMIWGPAQS